MRKEVALQNLAETQRTVYTIPNTNIPIDRIFTTEYVEILKRKKLVEIITEVHNKEQASCEPISQVMQEKADKLALNADNIVHLRADLREFIEYYQQEKGIKHIHLNYITYIEREMSKWRKSSKLRKWMKRYSKLIAALCLLDLSSVAPFILELYSRNPRGQKPADPISMFRSHIMMNYLGVESPEKWVEMLQDNRVLEALTGFAAVNEKLPTMSTYYRFMDRIIDGPFGSYDNQNARSKRIKQLTERKPYHLRGRKGNDVLEEQDQQGIESSAKLCDEYLAGNTGHFYDDFRLRLNTLLFHTVILNSASLGLFGDCTQLILAGDGSCLPTGANRFGQTTCDCRSRGIFKCDHIRLFSDATAEISFDAYRNAFYFGHNLYHLVYSGGGYDLPILNNIAPANHADFTLSIKSLVLFMDLCKLYAPHWKMDIFIGDGHHDSYGIHRFLHHLKIKPIIPLRENSKSQNKKVYPISDNNIPTCKAGIEMCNIGTNPKTFTKVYGCACKSRAANRIARCPLATDDNPDYRCQPDTLWGPTRKIHTSDDPRLFPVISRDSKQYKQHFKSRTCCERQNSYIKKIHNLDNVKHRSDELWLIRSTCSCIAHHIKVWINHLFFENGVDSDALLPWLRSLTSSLRKSLG